MDAPKQLLSGDLQGANLGLVNDFFNFCAFYVIHWLSQKNKFNISWDSLEAAFFTVVLKQVAKGSNGKIKYYSPKETPRNPELIIMVKGSEG